MLVRLVLAIRLTVTCPTRAGGLAVAVPVACMLLVCRVLTCRQTTFQPGGHSPGCDPHQLHRSKAPGMVLVCLPVS